MKVLLNLLPITSGGGQQVALTFLKSLSERSEAGSFIVIAKKKTEISSWLTSQSALRYRLSERSIFKRLWFEIIEINSITEDNNIDIVYTLFGTIFVTPKVKIVTGCAYSNLFYPEIDFWRVGRVKKVIKNSIDYLRLRSYRKADLVIFENQALADRAETQFGFKATIVLLPSISVKTTCVSDGGRIQITGINRSKFNFLLLTGWHVNKNLVLLLDVAEELKRQSQKKICFNITIDQSTEGAVSFFKAIKDRGIEEYFFFLGKVSSSDVEFIAKACDSVLLLSSLESFSNNLIEAWAYQRPLVVTDGDWSRSACGNAALYVNVHRLTSIVESVLTISTDDELYKRLVLHGTERLNRFPTPARKVQLHLEALENTWKSD